MDSAFAGEPADHIDQRGRALGAHNALGIGHDVDATIAKLVTAFPAAFTYDPVRVQPLKPGLKDDLYARSDILHRRITAALRSYCKSVNYLAALKQGAARVDLTGQPTGNITEAQAKHAVEVLKHVSPACSNWS
jgi:ProP effector